MYDVGNIMQGRQVMRRILIVVVLATILGCAPRRPPTPHLWLEDTYPGQSRPTATNHYWSEVGQTIVATAAVVAIQIGREAAEESRRR